MDIMSKLAKTIFILGQGLILLATGFWIWTIVTVSIEDGDGLVLTTAFIAMSLCTAYVVIKGWKGLVKLFSNAY
ncbi:MAG: hypothetical protein CL402_06195 [Acidiferrobacteraceae bacterium]|nr:hypothetical protein [Acidiferrobacteraceae bacterium]|tara:strand:+ start:515 stop:736 length:222 start_codon:yes stop_codon:yes gene_type:complete